MKLFRKKEGIVIGGRRLGWPEACRGFLALGQIGSGKSFSTEPIIEQAIRQGSPILSTAVKPDEFERYERICKRVGATERLVRVCPGSPYKINLLDELTRPPHGSPMHAAQFLAKISEVGKLNGQTTRDAFWETMEQRAMLNAICLCLLVLGKASIPDVYRVIMSSPRDPAHAASDEFNPNAPDQGRGFCAQLLVQASRNRTGKTDTAYRAVADFFISDLCGGGDRMRGGVIAGVNGCIGHFITDPWLDVLSPPESTLTPQHIEENRLITVLDYPLMIYHTPARLFQTAWVMLQQMYLMRRPAAPIDVPMWIIRDEAGWTLHPEWDASAQVTLRSQRCASFAIVQDIDMLQGCLGGGPKAQHEAMTFISNHMSKLFFSNTNTATNKWASGLFGMRREIMLSGGRGQTEAGSMMDQAFGVSGGTGWSEQWVPAVREEDFATVPVGCCYLHDDRGGSWLDMRR